MLEAFSQDFHHEPHPSLHFLLLVPIATQAQEPIRFAALSPISRRMASSVAFSYLGDIWLVDAKGGEARHLTMHEKRIRLQPDLQPRRQMDRVLLESPWAV